MPDIEDSFDVRTPIKANIGKSDENFFNIKIRAKKQKNEYADELKSEKNSNPLGSVLSWQKRVYLRTWGCSHNNSDSEYMSGLLTKAGFTVTSSKDLADLWLLNSCTVKTPSENLLVNQIKDAQNNGKKVCVAGCVSQAAPNEPWLKDVSIVGVQQIDRIVEVVDETIKGNVVRLLSQRRKDNLPLNLPKMRRNEFIEILAINSGCLNNCTYCKTKMARGDLRSFDLDSLVEQARKAYEEENCKEVWLTSEDLGAWGRDIGHVLPDLLEELVKVIPEGCMMRLGMTNPPYILDYLEDMAKILNHPRVYSFLHIPVQSGSNAVLTDMKREYTVEQFAHIVDYMKEHVPDIYIATDFICAFPTENKEDFEESLALVKKYEFPSLFINQFYPRPGTPAARLRKVETTEAKERTKEMTKLFHSYRRYTDHRIGMQYEVLICEMATDGISYVGHNKSYEHILVAPPADCRSLLGQRVRVEIVETAKFYMKGAIVEAPPVHKTDVLADIKLDPYRNYNCGMATTRMPEARVLNGMDVERGEWPWLAYISITTGDMTGSCTGTIISQR
ncbi:radical SAM superfamily domain-containing protein [Ditylenchus destructor]|uniref:tRNA-t(6)A37 methylthiotransferase n=1 Tax=Ditylenchus destructor TaxID=166010 RepID=A0AAD4NK32_9BILA|nr:radical SAM superfamily domain-containing protein [Ditylenchus destructor]